MLLGVSLTGAVFRLSRETVGSMKAEHVHMYKCESRATKQLTIADSIRNESNTAETYETGPFFDSLTASPSTGTFF